MCKASIRAKNTRPAKTTEVLCLGKYGEHPAFYAPGSSPEDCIVCVADGTQLDFFVGSESICRRLGIGASVIGTFEFKPHQVHDYVQLTEGVPSVRLAEFVDPNTRVVVLTNPQGLRTTEEADALYARRAELVDA